MLKKCQEFYAFETMEEQMAGLEKMFPSTVWEEAADPATVDGQVAVEKISDWWSEDILRRKTACIRIDDNDYGAHYYEYFVMKAFESQDPAELHDAYVRWYNYNGMNPYDSVEIQHARIRMLKPTSAYLDIAHKLMDWFYFESGRVSHYHSRLYEESKTCLIEYAYHLDDGTLEEYFIARQNWWNQYKAFGYFEQLLKGKIDLNELKNS